MLNYCNDTTHHCVFVPVLYIIKINYFNYIKLYFYFIKIKILQFIRRIRAAQNNRIFIVLQRQTLYNNSLLKTLHVK